MYKRQSYDVEFLRLDVAVEGIADVGIEAAARKARYQALRDALRPQELLLTAHHQQDQAETLLLQLLRGGGVAGLAAMPQLATFSTGWLLRPLLNQSRKQLRAYAEQHKLQWIEDPSNQDMALDRARMRHEVLPLLRQRWPQVDKVLARSAEHFAESASLLEELAHRDYLQCALGDGGLSIAALRQLSPAHRRNCLRYWLREQGEQAPSSAQLHQIEQDVLVEREDADPLFALTDVELRRYRDHLFCLKKLAPAPTTQRIAWTLTNQQDSELVLPEGCGKLRATPNNHASAGLPAGEYSVGFIQGGERIKPVGSVHNRRLKLLLQEGNVPPWVRRRMPLIYHGQRLVAVADRWVSAELQIPDSNRGFGLQWLDAPPGWQGMASSE